LAVSYSQTAAALRHLAKYVEISDLGWCANTSQLDDFDFVIETFDETTGLALNKIMADFSHQFLQGLDKGIKTDQSVGLNLRHPCVQAVNGLCFI